MGSLSKISILRPVTTVMILLMVILGGILGYSGLSLAMMPTMHIPIALVSTTYVGAGPNEIETFRNRSESNQYFRQPVLTSFFNLRLHKLIFIFLRLISMFLPINPFLCPPASCQNHFMIKTDHICPLAVCNIYLTMICFSYYII